MMTLNQSFIQTEKSSASGSLEMVLQSQIGMEPEVISEPYLALKFNFDHIFLTNIVGLAFHTVVCCRQSKDAKMIKHKVQ